MFDVFASGRSPDRSDPVTRRNPEPSVCVTVTLRNAAFNAPLGPPPAVTLTELPDDNLAPPSGIASVRESYRRTGMVRTTNWPSTSAAAEPASTNGDTATAPPTPSIIFLRDNRRDIENLLRRRLPGNAPGRRCQLITPQVIAWQPSPAHSGSYATARTTKEHHHDRHDDHR